MRSMTSPSAALDLLGTEFARASASETGERGGDTSSSVIDRFAVLVRSRSTLAPTRGERETNRAHPAAHSLHT